jgi:preprotein translocase subunit YajC
MDDSRTSGPDRYNPWVYPPEDVPVFISNAYAQAAGGAEGQLLGFLPIILMFVVLYFLMIRPQMKRAKEHQSTDARSALQKGDEVITSGGIVGKVSKVTRGLCDNVDVRHEAGEKPVEMQLQKAGCHRRCCPRARLKATLSSGGPPPAEPVAIRPAGRTDRAPGPTTLLIR